MIKQNLRWPAFSKDPFTTEWTITAVVVEGGVEVDNLSTQPFLPWKVFEETIDSWCEREIRAQRGRCDKLKAWRARSASWIP